MKDNRKKLKKWAENGYINPSDAKREIDIITQRLGEEVQENENTIKELIIERTSKSLITSFTINQLKLT